MVLIPAAAFAQDAKLPPAPVPAVNPLIARIAFGSCSNQDDPLPILRTVPEWEPDLFVYLGDNIDGDTRDMRLRGCDVDGERWMEIGAGVRAAILVRSISAARLHSFRRPSHFAAGMSDG